jgi:hypothetical protein
LPRRAARLSVFGLLVTLQGVGSLAASAVAGLLYTVATPANGIVNLVELAAAETIDWLLRAGRG